MIAFHFLLYISVTLALSGQFLSVLLPVYAQGEVFQVIGTQVLTELKDHISCVKDDAIAGDFSSCPNIANESLTPAKVV